MKLHEVLAGIKTFDRIKRKDWTGFLIKAEEDYRPLIKCDINSLEIGEYTLSFHELIASDWEVL